MRKNIAAVIEAWREARPHTAATCRTDGQKLWSYEMVIARRAPGGQLLVRDPNQAPTRTTKMQILAIIQSVPNVLVLPGGFS